MKTVVSTVSKIGIPWLGTDGWMVGEWVDGSVENVANEQEPSAKSKDDPSFSGFDRDTGQPEQEAYSAEPPKHLNLANLVLLRFPLTYLPLTRQKTDGS